MGLLCIYVFALISLCCSVGSCCERHGAKCPDYTVLQAFEDYEERSYPSLVWVSASESGRSKNEVVDALITRLYSYLGGGNDKGKNLDMMVPVRTTKVPSGGNNSTYTMSIALLPKYQMDPPVPTNPMVTMQVEHATVYVARSFGGKVEKETEWDTQADALKKSSESDEAVDSTFYYMSVYDSPWREENRLNEVWMIKRNS